MLWGQHSGLGVVVWVQGHVPPTPHGDERGQVSQQILEGALLVGLVGDVRQVHPAEVGGMVQDDITHVEGEDVVLEVLLQV